VADQLFATLDPTTRRLRLPAGSQVLLTDTVGFIRKLPHHLVASFRSTLKELVDADVLLHVVDASHAAFRAQMEAVSTVLEELLPTPRPQILVLNKADRLDEEARAGLRVEFPEALLTSALNGEGLDELRRALWEETAAGRTPA
jgi:GTP-binding protein HflX